MATFFGDQAGDTTFLAGAALGAPPTLLVPADELTE
jgi:hypothetical protein